MLDRGAGPKNKVELESQILCAALRQSWVNKETQGAVSAARELYQLFPDLLPPTSTKSKAKPINYYELLELTAQVPATSVVAAFLRVVKRFLRKQDPKDKREQYNRLLDAGFILRRPRLRLSHDLLIARHWLIESETISEDGTLESLQSGSAAESQLSKTQPITTVLPRLIQLLRDAQFIGQAEIQALSAQMTLAPDVPVERLILDSGYVSQPEMNSLKLAETLLGQGKISLAQFQVAIYDERSSGVRMAESLQVRGWLPVEVHPAADDGQEP